MSAEILALLDPSTPDTWPQGILAAADLRENRAKLVNEEGAGIWYVGDNHISGPGYAIAVADDPYPGHALTWHIAAEANPAHALAEVRLWREVAAWAVDNGRTRGAMFFHVVSAARAYLGGAS